ncbi:unnamed protein product, partial [Symbiodinium necroappetens]
ADSRASVGAHPRAYGPHPRRRGPHQEAARSIHHSALGGHATCHGSRAEPDGFSALASAPQPTAEEPAVKREILAPVVPSMTTITFLITLNIQPTAETEKIREILAQLAQSVAAKPGASFYQSYQKRPDQIEFIETFRDSDAALWHLQNQDQALAALWFTQIALESITIIGPASEALRNELAGYPRANKPVYIAGLSGFPPQVN